MKPRTEQQVREYAERLRNSGLTEEDVAGYLESGLTAGYECSFDEDQLKRGRSVLAVEMAEMNVRDLAYYALCAAAWLAKDAQEMNR